MTGPGRTEYTVFYADSVLAEDIPALPKTVRALVRKAIETRLTVAPIDYGKPLRYSLKGHRRLRVGDWRIVYRVDAKAKAVHIVAIAHRKNIYE